jgi:hypothetical protein
MDGMLCDFTLERKLRPPVAVRFEGADAQAGFAFPVSLHLIVQPLDSRRTRR